MNQWVIDVMSKEVEFTLAEWKLEKKLIWDELAAAFPDPDMVFPKGGCSRLTTVGGDLSPCPWP